MPLLIVTEGGKPMDKKKGFLDYGKDEDEEPAKDDEEGDAEEEDDGPAKRRIMHLAEQTGVDDPKALIKLIKACMAGG